MNRLVVALAATALVAGCSTTQYSNNGVGAFIPYDSHPNYTNIVVADTPYTPKQVVIAEKTEPAADIAQANSTPVVETVIKPTEPAPNQNPASEKALPATNSSNVVVTTINGDVIAEQHSTPQTESQDFQTADGTASYQMRPGLLKPQVVALLLNHPNIKDPSGVVWKARDNLTWPNNFRVSEADIDVVLNEILKPYKLYADFKKNNAVIISGGI